MRSKIQSSAPEPTVRAPGWARWRLFVRELRREGNTPWRHSVAMGVGVLVGCTPFYGFHLPLSYAAARMLRVSRLTVYLGANVSNPLVLPVLLLLEVQVGALLVRGHFHALSIQSMRDTNPWSFGLDLLAGAVVVGAVLGGAAAAVTYAVLRGRDAPDTFDGLALLAADRYCATSLTGWEFARGKLLNDPVYRHLLLGGALPSGGVLVDVGCGQGLMLAVLLEAAAMVRCGAWPADLAPPPRFDRLVGLEPRANVAYLAREATGGAATIVEGDARAFEYPPCAAMLFLDVLQMMTADDQELVLRSAMTRLTPGGVILIREADASAGRRFTLVRVGNRLKALLTGAWRQTLCYRRAEDWRGVFQRLGFEVEQCAFGEPGRFGNVLFRLTVSEPPLPK